MLARRTGNTAAAEDLAQQTWAAVWDVVASGRFDPSRARLSTLTYAIALNRYRDFARRTAASPFEPDFAASLDPISPGTDVGSAAAHAEVIDILRRALRGELAGLGPGHAEILRLVGQGVSERELAERLGVSPSTAHARRAAALARLRDVLIAERQGSPDESTPGPRP